MAIEKTWLVEQLTSYPTLDDHTDVVFSAAWRLNGTDGEHFATSYGSVGIAFEEGDDFTPYANVTSEMAIGWVKNALGANTVIAYETGIDNQIATLINPPSVVLPLPWNQ